MPQGNLYDVFWTDLAEESYSNELDFINTKWNLSEVVKFMDLVDEFVNKLELGIIVGKISKKTNIRSFVISKQTTLFFDVFEDSKEIELLLFWNNKGNPLELKKLLEG